MENQNKEVIEMKGKGKWCLSVFIEDFDDALVISDFEKVPLPNEDFDDYPVYITIPRKFNLVTMLIQVIKYSNRGIYSKAYKG